jgi:DNA-binding response OmpR family regulator
MNNAAGEARKVLVVDDDPYIFELVQIYIASDRVEILQAPDAYTGLDLALREDPDVILLDIMMPGMDGLEMCRLLRDTPEIERIPVIILSAKAKKKDIEAGYEAGADDYVTKPFEPDVLARRIDRMLGNSGRPGSR